MSEESSSFQSTMIFYCFAALFLLVSSSLYFVEKRNKFSKYFYSKQMMYNQSQPTLGVIEQTKVIFSSCEGSWFYILNLTFTFICTYTVYPGVTNNAPLTFLDFKGPWHQLFMITLYNSVETIGRYVGGKV